MGEIRDEIRYIGKNVDLVMARLKHNRDIKEMAEYSLVPVINGCCDKYHPCQAMADFMTIKELFGTFHIRVLYIGIRNNVFNSLAEGLVMLGADFYALTPVTNPASYDEALYQKLEAADNFTEVPDTISQEELKKLAGKIDVIYTDSWMDMEFFHDSSYKEEKEARIEKMGKYQINQYLLENSQAAVMHDMPMHEGYEITRDVIEENIETILTQAENRRHIEKALLVTLAKKS